MCVRVSVTLNERSLALGRVSSSSAAFAFRLHRSERKNRSSSSSNKNVVQSTKDYGSAYCKSPVKRASILKIV